MLGSEMTVTLECRQEVASPTSTNRRPGTYQSKTPQTAPYDSLIEPITNTPNATTTEEEDEHGTVWTRSARYRNTIDQRN